MLIKKTQMFFKAEASLHILAVYTFMQKHSGGHELFVNYNKEFTLNG